MNELKALSRVAREAEKRSLRKRRLPVFDYRPSNSVGRLALAAPGTVTLYLARRGAPILNEIAETVVRKSARDVDLAKRIRKILEDRPCDVPVHEAVNLLLKEEVFADLRYGGKTIVSNLFVPKDMEVVSVVFPYNGGRLAREGFTLVEHAVDGATQGLMGILVRSSPPLTRAEAVALKLVPSSQLEANVGTALVGEEDDNLAVTLVTLAALAAGVALAAAAEVAVPAAVVAEAAGVGVGEIAAEMGVGAAVGAAVDAAVAWAEANADVAVLTVAAATDATADLIGVQNADGNDATVNDAIGIAVDAGDAGDAGAGDAGAGDAGAGDAGAGAGDAGAGAAGAGDAGAGAAGAGDAGAGAAGAGDAGAGAAGAGDAGAGAGDAGAGAGDAGAGDAGAGDAGAGDAGAGDAGGGSNFARQLIDIASAEAVISGLEIQQVLTERAGEITALRDLASKLRPAQTARQLLDARRKALGFRN